MISAEHVRRFRAHAMHLSDPAPSLERAAWGGLQDSAPRTALLSLHARATDVGPASWEDPAFVQIWGPRLAVYVVPRQDLGVFTLGRLPRDERRRALVEEAADRLLGALDGANNDVSLRLAGASGRILVRWDARSSSVLATERPSLDPEVARVELARRYVRWLGPGTEKDFARWAGIEPRDARETWRALEPELEPVDIDGAREWIHALDIHALADPVPATGVRLLPPGDPFLASARERILPDAAKHPLVWPKPNAVPRLPNGKPFAPGAILLDGEIVGIWARTGARVTVLPWVAPGSAARAPGQIARARDQIARARDQIARARDQIARAAESLAGPLGEPVRLDWA